MISNIKNAGFLKEKTHKFPIVSQLVLYFKERVEINTIVSNIEYLIEDLKETDKVEAFNLDRKNCEKYLKSFTEDKLKKMIPVFFFSEENSDVLDFFIKLNKFCPVLILVTKKNLTKILNLNQELSGFSGIFKETSRDKRYSLYIGGYLTNISKFNGIKKRICAIVSTYEDEDIIEDVCNYLLGQEMYLHVIDNWSKDRTYSILENLSKLNLQITLERFPNKFSSEYIWKDILDRKAKFAEENKFDWYIHYDSDEIRESCWEGYNLNESISFVDSLGYTAIDHTVLDFRPVNNDFSEGKSLLKSFDFFEFGMRLGHFQQVKAWKNLNPVDLSSSGGHMVDFQERKIFPFKFLLRHYPLRNLEQMRKKIFKDRLPRITKEKKELGWHVQYDNFVEGKEKIKLWRKRNLLKYGSSFKEKYLVERLTGVNILK